jgi:hypothetical protein
MTLLPPREVKFSLLFFKTMAGLGVGIIGTVILLIFVMLGLGATNQLGQQGPFLIFSAIVMSFITGLVANGLGTFLFAMLDQEKYAEIRVVLRQIISLNILVFIFLLPIHFFVILGARESLQMIFLVATLQLVISAIASMFILELSNAKSKRENFMAVYGITFAIMVAVILNVIIFQIGQHFSSQAELAIGGSGGKGATMVLYFILPLIWLLFGFFTTLSEMLYRWFYQTWGLDPLNRGE